MIETERLKLRAFTLADASEVTRLAGARDIASTTLNIPHPYSQEMAEAWIRGNRERQERGEVEAFAITRRRDGRLLGAIALTLRPEHGKAELGYWIGKSYWGHGYATEAAAAVLRHAFEALGLNKVYAHHLSRNPASGSVMRKIGMSHEGRLRQEVRKWGVAEDLERYAILREEWVAPE